MEDRSSQRGWALVSVLWGLVIISLIAAVMLSSARVSYRQAAYSVEQAQEHARADAAMVRAVLGLLDTRLDHRWRIDGIGQSWTFDGHDMRVAVQDEGGKIDLNASGDVAIRQLLNGIGPDAAGLADKILDWRDQKGDLHRINGATAKTYVAAGRDYLPRGGPYQSVDELKLVLGMTPALFAQLGPNVTVNSGRSKVNFSTAPAAVLMALLGQGSAVAAATVAARQGAVEQVQGQPIINGVVALGIPIDGWVFSIKVDSARSRTPSNRMVMVTGTDHGGRYYRELASP